METCCKKAKMLIRDTSFLFAGMSARLYWAKDAWTQRVWRFPPSVNKSEQSIEI